jgi:hypothetical protein
MKINHLLPIAVIALGGLSMGSGCPTMPKLEDRIVELAIGGTTTLAPPFHGQSTVNTLWTSASTYNLATDIDINSLISGADIDLQDVTAIKLDKIWYRVSTGNGASRVISGGKVTVQRQGAASASDLVSNFTQNVKDVTPFIRAPLSSAGVDVLNTILADVLAAQKAGTATANPQITYTVTGTADGLPYDFFWELKLDLTISGKIKKIQVLN